MKPIKEVKTRIDQLEKSLGRWCSVNEELETLKKHLEAVEKGVKCDDETLLKTATNMLNDKKFSKVRALLWIME